MYGPNLSEKDFKVMAALIFIGIAAVVAIVLGGIGFGIWFVINHVQIV